MNILVIPPFMVYEHSAYPTIYGLYQTLLHGQAYLLYSYDFNVFLDTCQF